MLQPNTAQHTPCSPDEHTNTSTFIICCKCLCVCVCVLNACASFNVVHEFVDHHVPLSRFRFRLFESSTLSTFSHPLFSSLSIKYYTLHNPGWQTM